MSNKVLILFSVFLLAPDSHAAALPLSEVGYLDATALQTQKTASLRLSATINVLPKDVGRIGAIYLGAYYPSTDTYAYYSQTYHAWLKYDGAIPEPYQVLRQGMPPVVNMGLGDGSNMCGYAGAKVYVGYGTLSPARMQLLQGIDSGQITRFDPLTMSSSDGSPDLQAPRRGIDSGSQSSPRGQNKDGTGGATPDRGKNQDSTDNTRAATVQRKKPDPTVLASTFMFNDMRIGGKYRHVHTVLFDPSCGD